jgi:hypothetical protein
MADRPDAVEVKYLIGGLQRFESTADERIFRHCENVVNRLKPLLFNHLKKQRPNDCRNTVLTWMTLGKRELSAKPWIVCYCPECAKECAEDFFRQDYVQNICTSSDVSLPNLSAIVEKPIRPLAYDSSTVILGSGNHGDEKHWTMRIQYPTGAGFRYATMGGFLVVVDNNDKRTLCGMTAGHVFDPQSVETDLESEQIGREEKVDLPSSTSPIPAVLGFSSPEKPSEAQNTDFAQSETANIDSAIAWNGIGQLSRASSSTRARNRDWALIEEAYNFGRRSYLANGLVERFIPGDAEGACNSASNAVQISSEPTFVGSFARESSYAILPFGNEFVRVHAIRLPGTQGKLHLKAPGLMAYILIVTPDMLQGHSGSWVHNSPATQSLEGELKEQTFCIFGHVVADDAFGNVYLVPLNDTLSDMKQELGVKEVRLPTSTLEIQDIASHFYFDQEMLRRARAGSSVASTSLAPESILSGYSTPLTETEDSPEVMPEDQSDAGISTMIIDPLPEAEQHTGAAGKDQKPQATVDSTSTTTMSFNGMRLWNREVDLKTMSRYHQMRDSLESGLVQYISRKGAHYIYPLSFRLVILGHNHEDARPYIVIVCHRRAKRWAKRFMRKASTRNILKGLQDDTELKVMVVSDNLIPK